MKFYPLQITEDALFPRGTCVQCVNSAIAAQEFRILTRNSEKIWRHSISALSPLHRLVKTEAKSICAVITAQFDLKIIEDHEGVGAVNTLNHLRIKMPAKKSSEKKKRVQRSGPTSRCTDCGKEFMSPFYLQMHLRNSGQKEACTICGEIMIRGEQLKDHLIEKHGKNAILCKECPSVFMKEQEYTSHVKKAHKLGALTCTHCGRTFARPSSFDFHSQMHAVRTCRSCGAQFSNRGCYREHRAHCEPDAKPKAETMSRSRRSNIRDPATFTCDYCGKTYASRPQLKNHIIWIHMDVRPHQCQWCGKRFYTPARLAEHTVVHTRERNFACDICGLKLVTKMAAVYHRRRHTGEKPYKCEDCGDAFISASRRSEHAKRKHGKGKRFQCQHCPQNYVRGHDLRKHMEKAHKESPNAKSDWTAKGDNVRVAGIMSQQVVKTEN